MNLLHSDFVLREGGDEGFLSGSVIETIYLFSVCIFRLLLILLMCFYLSPSLF